MTEDMFKAPKSKRSLSKYDYETYGSPPKRPRTRDDFVAFCNIVLQYTQYEEQRQEDLRAQHNLSPLDSIGSTGDSYSSDSTSSSFSSSSQLDTPRRGPSLDTEEDSLITCHCLKPYAGRPMIECSECDTWIHLSCAKIRKSNIPDTFVCQQCRDSKFTMRKSSRSRTETKRISV